MKKRPNVSIISFCCGVRIDLKDVAVYRQRELVDRLKALVEELCQEFCASYELAKASAKVIECFPSNDAVVPNGTNDNPVVGDKALSGADR